MSIENEDYPVKPLSDYEIDQLAWRNRLSTGTADEPAPDILSIVATLSRSGAQLEGLEIVVLPDQEMPRDEALAFVDQRVLQVRQSVFDGARRGRPRDRMTLAHEIGHFILGHGGAPKHRVAVGNTTLPYIPAHKSAEHQAKVFASSFLMLRNHVQECKSATEVASLLNVSLQSAAIRWQQVTIRDAPKTIPQDILDNIDVLKKKSNRRPVTEGIRPSMLSLEQQVKMAWEVSPIGDGLDQNEYRCIDNRWIIRRSRLNEHKPGGWWLDNEGKLIVWENETSK